MDNFKNVNDTYGHAAGDAVLREIASRLLGSVRSYDSVSRYGGEEFLVVLSGVGSEIALARAEQIRRAVETRPIETSEASVHVTVSLGAVVSTDWDELNGEGLIREADAALYRAKKEGRNRVVLSRPVGLKGIPEDRHPNIVSSGNR